jgi:hypothetical protein
MKVIAMRKRRMKRPITLAVVKPENQVYERLAEDLPTGAVVDVVLVDDPLERGAKLKVLRSIRNDQLAGMRARGQIDDAMYEAGRQWELYYEKSEICGVRAIDLTKETVDGGKPNWEPVDDRHIKAGDELARADRTLGAYGASLIWDILGRRMSISELAQYRMMTRQREIDYLGARFKECLETLAKLWGFAG